MDMAYHVERNAHSTPLWLRRRFSLLINVEFACEQHYA